MSRGQNHRPLRLRRSQRRVSSFPYGWPLKRLKRVEAFPPGLLHGGPEVRFGAHVRASNREGVPPSVRFKRCAVPATRASRSLRSCSRRKIERETERRRVTMAARRSTRELPGRFPCPANRIGRPLPALNRSTSRPDAAGATPALANGHRVSRCQLFLAASRRAGRGLQATGRTALRRGLPG